MRWWFKSLRAARLSLSRLSLTIFFYSVVLLIMCQWRLKKKLEIYSSIFMRTFTHSSQRLACLLVKSSNTKPFIVAMMLNQANIVYILTLTFVDSFNSGGYQMFIIFDQSVDLYKSNLVVDTFSLLTRLGGDVGFCKEILWILFIILSGFEFGRSFCLKSFLRSRNFKSEKADLY